MLAVGVQGMSRACVQEKYILVMDKWTVIFACGMLMKIMRSKQQEVEEEDNDDVEEEVVPLPLHTLFA